MLCLIMGGGGKVGVVSSCLFAEQAIHLDDSLVFSHGIATCRPVVKSIVRSDINEEHLVALNKTLYIVRQETLPRD